MSLEIPNSFSDGATISATEVNANFDAVESALGNISNADISPDAGITSDRLQDRFAVCYVHIPLQAVTIASPETEAATDAATSADTTAEGSTTRLARFYPTIKSGRRCELVSITVFSLAHSTVTSTDPVVAVYHNSTLLSGAGVTMTSQGPFYLKNASPHTQPLATLQDGDYLDFHCYRSGTGGAPTLAGLQATVCLKYEVEA